MLLLCGHIQTVRYSDGGCVGAVSFLDHLTRTTYAVHGEWPEPLLDVKKTVRGGALVQVALTADTFHGKAQYRIVNFFAESLPLARTLLGRYNNPTHISQVVHALFAPHQDTSEYPSALAGTTAGHCLGCEALPAADVARAVCTIFSSAYVAFCDRYALASTGRTRLWTVGQTSEHTVHDFITRAPYQAARVALQGKAKKDQTFAHLDALVIQIFAQPEHAPERVRRFTVEAVKQLISETHHTCVLATTVLHHTLTLLGAPAGSWVDRIVEDLWMQEAGPWYTAATTGFKQGELDDDWSMHVETRICQGVATRFVYPFPHWQAEQTIALHCMLAAHPMAKLSLLHNDTVFMDTGAAQLSPQLSQTLDPVQANVLTSVTQYPLTVLTGSPGTGKTFVTSLVVAHLQTLGYTVLVACPTGRAAQRLTALLPPDQAAQLMFGGPITLHKLLESHHPAFATSETIALIVDELSMTGLQLFASVLRMLPLTQKIVLVGDPYQLPSIPPGKLMSDFLQAAPSLVHVCSLQRVYRTRGRTICANAQVVRQMIAQDEQGVMSAPTSRAVQLQHGDDFVVLDRRTSVMDRATAAIGFYQSHHCAFTHCQVLCQKVDTCQTLNLCIRDAVNPTGPEYQRYHTSRVWRLHDRVICTRNIYSRQSSDDDSNADGSLKIVACNGQMGTLCKIHGASGPDAKLGICFDDGEALVTMFLGSEMNEYFDWAYAITVHKAQGGEWQFVYMHLDAPDRSPLHCAHLFYTAFTRAQEQVIVDGPRVCIERALAVTNVVAKRCSFLATRLQNTAAAQAALRRLRGAT